MGFYPLAVSQHTNTLITQSNTQKNQFSSQSYTNNEGHIAANDYRVEKEKK
jgi:hypothetical protein